MKKIFDGLIWKNMSDNPKKSENFSPTYAIRVRKSILKFYITKFCASSWGHLVVGNSSLYTKFVYCGFQWLQIISNDIEFTTICWKFYYRNYSLNFCGGICVGGRLRARSYLNPVFHSAHLAIEIVKTYENIKKSLWNWPDFGSVCFQSGKINAIKVKIHEIIAK